MVEPTDLLSYRFLGNSTSSWAIAALVATAIYLIALLLRGVVRRAFERMAATSELELMELPFQLLSRTTMLFLIVLAIFVGAHTLALRESVWAVLASVMTIVAIWQAGLWLTTVVSAWLDRKRRHSLPADRAAVSSLGIIAFVARLLIWAFALLLALDNLGVDITALVAGLGIGGIAIALAVQNLLGDLLASLSITLDKPFVLGDALGVGDFNGTVEYIGIKSTRLRSVSGEQIIISNADLLASRVRNYGRLVERRATFAIGVTYETPRESLREIPALMRSIIEAQPGTRFDRCHFTRYAPASLDFETVYVVLSADFNEYMDIQQAINLAIHEQFERRGIEFASTQKLRISRGPAAAGATADAAVERSPAR